VAWVVAVLALLVGRPLDAQRRDEAPPLSTARVAGQIGVGVLLTPVAFFGTAWLTDRLFEPDPQGEGVRRFQYAASYTTTWLAAAAGPALVGGDGRFPAALGGSLAGLGGAFLTARLGNRLFDDGRRSCNVFCWSLGALTVALPAIGATIAYDASRR
jgi:hypothetical protein